MDVHSCGCDISRRVSNVVDAGASVCPQHWTRASVCSLTASSAGIAAGSPASIRQDDVTIDAVPTSVEIDKALARLEELAMERGVAVGMTSALPVAIDRIGAWTKGLESRGVMLVPLTTAMLKSKSS